MISPVPVGIAPFNAKAAVEYGLFVKAAYTMYNQEPQSPVPQPTSDFPPGYRLSSWITMQDFVFDSTPPQFMGSLRRVMPIPIGLFLQFVGHPRPPNGGTT